jgi:hypothetical protein
MTYTSGVRARPAAIAALSTAFHSSRCSERVTGCAPATAATIDPDANHDTTP